MKNKKEFLSEGLKKMQRLAGIIPESNSNEESNKEINETFVPYTKLEKRNRVLLENVDRMKALSGIKNSDSE